MSSAQLPSTEHCCPTHLPSQPCPLTCPCDCVLQPFLLSLPPYTSDFTPTPPTIPLPYPSYYPSPLPLLLPLTPTPPTIPHPYPSYYPSPLPLLLSLSPTPPTTPHPYPSYYPSPLPLLLPLTPTPPTTPHPYPSYYPSPLPLLLSLSPTPPTIPHPYPSYYPSPLPLLLSLSPTPPTTPHPYPSYYPSPLPLLLPLSPTPPTIPLPYPSYYPSPLPLLLPLSPTPPTIPPPCPSYYPSLLPLSPRVQESVALMQICQHSKFVHHVPDSIAPCFVPVMPSCQEMMQSSHCTIQSSPPEPLPLVYSLAPSTVAYFPPPPIAQQTDDRGYASAESSPLMQVSKSHDCHVITMSCDHCHAASHVLLQDRQLLFSSGAHPVFPFPCSAPLVPPLGCRNMQPCLLGACPCSAQTLYLPPAPTANVPVQWVWPQFISHAHSSRL